MFKKLALVLVLALCLIAAAGADGRAMFYIRACGSAQDNIIYVSNDLQQLPPFDNTYHPDRTPTDTNEGYLQVPVLKDCVSEPVHMGDGHYTAYLRNGNGNQPEQQKFIIGGGGTERVTFLGAAVAFVNHTAPACIEKAHWEYRYRDWLPGQIRSHIERQIWTFTRQGWVVTTPWEDGRCMLRCYGLTLCGERTVIDETPGMWSEWSAWDLMEPLQKEGREIESKWVEQVNNCCCNCGCDDPVKSADC